MTIIGDYFRGKALVERARARASGGQARELHFELAELYERRAEECSAATPAHAVPPAPDPNFAR